MDDKLLHLLTLWSGRVAALLFVLNFTTCFVMPWARNKLPWKGSKPGKDDKDKFGWFAFTASHKWFAWSTIISVGIHIVFSVFNRR